MKYSPELIAGMKNRLSSKSDEPSATDSEAEEALNNLCRFFEILNEIKERECVSKPICRNDE